MSETTKRFSVRVEPLVAEVGDDLVLKFRPEIGGTEYLDAYGRLLDRQKAAEDDPSMAEGAKKRLNATMAFLRDLAEPETASVLDDPATVIPVRVLAEVVEWLTSQYTGSAPGDKGAQGARPTPRR